MLIGFLKIFFRCSSFLAPKTAGKIAFTLFCTPQKPASKNVEYRKRLAQGNQLLAAGEKQFLKNDDTSIATWRIRTSATQPLGYIMLIHGWSSRSALMASLIEPLLSQGYDVVVFDLPAHGESSGKRLTLPAAVAAIHAVHRHYGGWSGIVAHSFGGIVATSAVSGAVVGFSALPCSQLVLISAPESVRRVFTDFAQFLGLNSKALESFIHEAEAISGNYIDHYCGGELIKSLKIPTLVLHAEDDKEVSYESAVRFDASGPLFEHIPINGAGHRRIIKDERTHSAIERFLDKSHANVKFN